MMHLLLIALILLTTPAWAVSPDEAAGWSDDLLFVRETLPAVHPDPFNTLPRETFDSSIDMLIDRLPSMGHAEIIAELAAVGDGHTRLTLPMSEGSERSPGRRSIVPHVDVFPRRIWRISPRSLAVSGFHSTGNGW